MMNNVPIPRAFQTSAINNAVLICLLYNQKPTLAICGKRKQKKIGHPSRAYLANSVFK
jgi:hypothetical protein